MEIVYLIFSIVAFCGGYKLGMKNKPITKQPTEEEIRQIEKIGKDLRIISGYNENIAIMGGKKNE